MYLIYDAHSSSIQRLTFPNATFLPWGSKNSPKSQYPTDAVDPWCFSHWPGARCFITHAAASQNQKKRMVEWFPVRVAADIQPHYID